MEARVPGPAPSLTDFRTEVLEIICRPLSVKDRVSLSHTCPAFWHGLASSQEAWGKLSFKRARAGDDRMLHFLAHRRQGLRHLELIFVYEYHGVTKQAGAKLAACLEGSPLVQLRLQHLSGEGSNIVLQWLGSCTALTSLALMECSLRCLPGALEQLRALADLSLAGNELGESSWLQQQKDEHQAGRARLAQLTALTRLDISCCSLATLPAGLAALPALAALDLHGNWSLADAAKDAWDLLAQCSSLTSLCLGHIPLRRLPQALAALAPHLLDLGLEHTRGGGLWDGAEAALGPLYSLSRLTRLNIQGCLAGLPLLKKLSCLVALQDLNLSTNKFSVGGPMALEGLNFGNHPLFLGVGLVQVAFGNNVPFEVEAALRSLSSLSALTRLNLRDCRLTRWPEEIGHLHALRDLDFGNNPLKLGPGQSLRALHSLSSLSALTQLNFRDCRLTHWPEEIGHLHALKDLDFGRNPLKLGPGQDLQALRSLSSLSTLTRLNLRDCRLTHWPEEIPHLQALKDLDFGSNPLKLGVGQDVQALPSLSRLSALTQLNLRDCCLTCWPEEIRHLQALKVLDFGNNPLDLVLNNSWQCIQWPTALTRLNMDGWNVKRLPPRLTELRSLAELSLRQNKLLGISWDPARWKPLEQLTALTCLDASECRLHSVPSASAALHGLQVLRLANNPDLGRGDINPEVFRPLVKLTALQHLDLSGCSLPIELQLEVDAIPFPLHRLEQWVAKRAERCKESLDESGSEMGSEMGLEMHSEGGWGTDLDSEGGCEVGSEEPSGGTDLEATYDNDSEEES